MMLPALVGIGLGAAAFAADLVPVPVGKLLTPVVSSAFGWGAAALIAAMSARRLGSAMGAGVGALVLATVTYYSLVLFGSMRWYHGLDGTGGGLPASADGLASVARSAGFWLGCSVLGGAFMGILGHVVRRGSARHAPVALGVAVGLLAGEGAYTLFHTVFIWTGPIDSFVWGKVQGALVQIVLAAGALSLAVRLRRGRAMSWSTFGVSLAVTLAASVGLWFTIQLVRPLL